MSIDVCANGSSQSAEPLLGKRVTVLPGAAAYGTGRDAIVVRSYHSEDEVRVDLLFDGETDVRCNYTAETYRLLDDDALGLGAVLVHLRHASTQRDTAQRERADAVDRIRALEERIGTLETSLREAQSRVQRIVSEHDEWKRRATVTAHEYAERHDLCQEFDRCMEAIGLEGRERDYTVPVEVNLTVHVNVRAKSADEAEDAATDYGALDSVVIDYVRHNSYDHDVVSGWND